MNLILSNNLGEEAKRLDERLRALRPDVEGEIRIANGIMEKIKTSLQQIHPFNNANFQIAGSLKKNTMLTARKEFDLIVSFPTNLQDYPPTEQTRRNLLSFVAKKYGVLEPASNHQNSQIELSGWNVDILPTFQIEIQEFLKKSTNAKKIYKPYMCLKHVEFVKKRGQKYQELCRLVKFWTNGPEYLIDRYPYSSSWFIELVAASSFAHDKNWNLVQHFESFLRRLINVHKKKFYVAFDDYYKKTSYKQRWLQQITVLDPTDPDDNLATRGYQKEGLPQLVNRAKETLEIWEKENFEAIFQKYFSRDPD